MNRAKGAVTHPGTPSGDGELPVGDVGTPWRLLLFSVRRAPGWTATLVLSRMAGTATILLLPAALATAVDAALAGAGLGPALVWLGVLLGTTLLAEMMDTWASTAMPNTVELSLRRGMVDRVLRAGIPSQPRFAPGDLSIRLVTGTSEASGLVPTVLSVAESAVLAVGGLVALILIDWTLALSFVVCLPVAAVLIRRFMSEATELLTRYQELQGSLSARLVDAMSGARSIRAAGTLRREAERVLEPLPELSATGLATWDAERRTVWKVMLLAPLVEITVLAVAGVGVADGRISAGSWIAAAGYVGIALGLLSVVGTMMDFAEVRAGTARLVEVLALPDGPGGTLPLPDGPGALSFRGVTVQAGEKVVLDGLDLDIPAGLMVAIVGRSGGGKSTLAALAGGLIAPDRGQVLLDGVPVTELRPDQLRRAVAYAFQRPALLGETLHDTIAYGNPEIRRDQVELAAIRAAADGFIRRLPRGYDTPVSQAPLSGGEVQRLGLARAVAGERRVLILDDATSSLDTATEAEVSTTLAGLLAGRTRILVAHRAGTASRADLVVWLENGRVRAVGGHEVLHRNPDYRALFGRAGEVPWEPA